MAALGVLRFAHARAGSWQQRTSSCATSTAWCGLLPNLLTNSGSRGRARGQKKCAFLISFQFLWLEAGQKDSFILHSFTPLLHSTPSHTIHSTPSLHSQTLISLVLTACDARVLLFCCFAGSFLIIAVSAKLGAQRKFACATLCAAVFPCRGFGFFFSTAFACKQLCFPLLVWFLLGA